MSTSKILGTTLFAMRTSFCQAQGSSRLLAASNAKEILRLATRQKHTSGPRRSSSSTASAVAGVSHFKESTGTYEAQTQTQEESLFHDFKYHRGSPKLQDVNERFRDTITNDEERPLVFLFGWAGANAKNITKYSHIYHQAGCDTIAYILPTRFIYDITSEIPFVAQRLLKVTEMEGLLNRPLFFHNMSDTGLMAYQGIRTVANKENINLDIRGAVMDSCPGPKPNMTFARLSVLTVVRIICNYRDGMTWSGAVASGWQTARERMIPDYINSYRGIPFELSMIDGEWSGDYLKKELDQMHPELFIYSKSDFYLPWKYLEQEVLPKREAAGRSFVTQRWDRSPHVGHLRAHKKDYVNAVHNFLYNSYFKDLKK